MSGALRWDRHAGSMDGWMDGWMREWMMDVWMKGRMQEVMGLRGSMEGCMKRWMHEGMDGWVGWMPRMDDMRWTLHCMEGPVGRLRTNYFLVVRCFQVYGQCRILQIFRNLAPTCG